MVFKHSKVKNANKIKNTILELEYTREILIEELNIDNIILDKYLSGKTFFEEDKFLEFLEFINLDKEDLGFIEFKTEETIKNLFLLFVPKKETLIVIKNGFLAIIKSFFKKRDRKNNKEYLAQDLFFERNYHKPVLFSNLFLSLLGLIVLISLYLNKLYWA